MKFRYTFEKDFKKMEILISLISMPIYMKYINRGYKVIKREIFDNGQWIELI